MEATTKHRKALHIPRRSGVGARQVLTPGRRKTAPHPWRDRIRNALNGNPSEFAKARRVPFFKGHGVASENAYNLRYDCPCGMGIVGVRVDPEFMTDVMDHETEHAEQVSA